MAVTSNPPTFDISSATTPSDLDAVRDLLRLNASSNHLPLSTPELHTLPGDYSPPSGTLLLARSSPAHLALPRDIPLGIITYKTTQYTPAGCCEMNRLYVSPTARGLGVGKALVLELLRTAKEAGYKEMRLGVFVENDSAVRLYEGVGFEKRERYKLKIWEGSKAYYIEL